MAAHAKRIEIAPEDRPVLERWARSRVCERRLCDRARMVLMSAEGRPASEIGARLGCSGETAKRWRSRYEREGIEGLRDRPKSGRPITHDDAKRAKLIALACTRPPNSAEGVRRERWSYAELAAEVGISSSRAHAILAEADVRPHLTDYWVMSELGEDFDAQAAEVCGLYLDPPENAIVVSIDEKSGVQAKGRRRADTLPGPGRPARRDSEYVRNGTQNLFAALQVHAGEVSPMASKTRNRFDFIRFLDQLEGEVPAGKRVIAVLDNLSTHKTKEVEEWLAAHPRWRFQFTPKHASWLNQVEIFFSILQRRVIKHGVFDSEQDLATQMLAFVEQYNLTATPFLWTYTGKVLVA
ncbi:MAG: IS630 family transposase [Actinobacteria bacterium]|nr:IS630 family transposase [Actinomycetota bacterium]